MARDVCAHRGLEPPADGAKILTAPIAMHQRAAARTRDEVSDALLFGADPAAQQLRRELGGALEILLVMDLGVRLERARQPLGQRIELLARHGEQLVRCRQRARGSAEFGAPRVQSARPAGALTARKRIDLRQ